MFNKKRSHCEFSFTCREQGPEQTASCDTLHCSSVIIVAYAAMESMMIMIGRLLLWKSCSAGVYIKADH